jgi:hypothetical protein
MFVGTVPLSLPAHPLTTIIRYVERTRELYFHAAATRTDAPATPTLYRVRVCRDGSCPAVSPIECALGVATPDGRHCFRSPMATASYDDALTACETAGGTLASVRSPDELVAVNDLLTASMIDSAWLGGNTNTGPLRWEDGPAFDFWVFRGGAFLPWRAMEPSMLAPPNGVLAGQAADFVSWRLADADLPDRYVCETYDWPSW